jgi:uncharacterized membrane protein
MDTPAPPSPAVNTSRWIAVGCALALIVLGLAWELGVARSLWAIKVLPLTFALAGLSKMRLYTYRWTSLLVWLYAADGAVRVLDPAPVRWLAWGELLLALALFTACAVHVRSRLKSGKA